MKRLLPLPLLALAATLLSGCVYGRAARKCLNEPWTGLEIRRRDSFVNPTYDPNRRIHLTEEAKTRKEPLPTIVVVEPDALREIRQAFPSGNLEPSFKPGVLLNFECVATTESGETVSLWFFDNLVKGPESSAGTLSVSVSPKGDFHCKGPAADRFFENLWRVCRQRGLFAGPFSDFIVTSDESRRLFEERIRERDVRLERELNGLGPSAPAASE